MCRYSSLLTFLSECYSSHGHNGYSAKIQLLCQNVVGMSKENEKPAAPPSIHTKTHPHLLNYVHINMFCINTPLYQANHKQCYPQIQNMFDLVLNTLASCK